jgi:hypothetical protein
MQDANRSIFRADAIQRYAQSREESVLPRFVSPPVFICLWILLGLLVAGGFIAWFAQVPVYASGPAIVVDGKGKTQSIGDDALIVTFVPPENLPRLRVGQTLFLNLPPAGEHVGVSIMAVEPEISSPAAARRRFALSPGAAQAITQPSAVAIARWESVREDLPASAYVGSVYRADIEVGSRRVVSLLPVIGQFFGG